jgi:hypothetical protein
MSSCRTSSFRPSKILCFRPDRHDVVVFTISPDGKLTSPVPQTFLLSNMPIEQAEDQSAVSPFSHDCQTEGSLWSALFTEESCNVTVDKFLSVIKDRNELASIH